VTTTAAENSGIHFDLPAEPERADRLRVVLHVLYLVFNEGYTTSSGPALQRADLTTEAIRLARLVHQRMPGEGEVAGLLALMLLTDARRAAGASARRWRLRPGMRSLPEFRLPPGVVCCPPSRARWTRRDYTRRR